MNVDVNSPDFIIGVVAGVFTIPVLFLVVGALAVLKNWWDRKPPERIARYRSWRIARLTNRANKIRYKSHWADDER